MTENAKLVLAELKKNYGKEDLTKQDIAATLGIPVSAVTGTVNGLVKKGRATENIIDTEDEGKKVKKRFVMLNEAGMAFDPDADEKPKKAQA